MRREVQLLGSVSKAGRQEPSFDNVLASCSDVEHRHLALRHCWFHNSLSILRATPISYVVAPNYKLRLIRSLVTCASGAELPKTVGLSALLVILDILTDISSMLNPLLHMLSLPSSYLSLFVSLQG